MKNIEQATAESLPLCTKKSSKKVWKDSILLDLVGSQKSQNGLVLRETRRKIRERKSLLLNNHYNEKAIAINDAAVQRDVAREFKLAKFSSAHEKSRTVGAGDSALRQHFEAHFADRDSLPIPEELLESAELESADEGSSGSGNCELVVDEGVPTKEEIKQVLGQIKNRRCREIDGLWGEQLKYGLDSETLVTSLLTLLQLIWLFVATPLIWSKCTLSCIFKNKGSARDAKNYRAISVTATLSRIFSQIFLNRVRPVYNRLLGDSQCGFRSGCVMTQYGGSISASRNTGSLFLSSS